MRSAQQRSAEAPGRGPEASARAVRERLVGLIGTGSRTFTEHSSRLSGLVKKRRTPPNLHRFGGASRTTGPADRRTATRPIGSPHAPRELRPTLDRNVGREATRFRNHYTRPAVRPQGARRSRAGCAPPSAHPAEVTRCNRCTPPRACRRAARAYDRHPSAETTYSSRTSEKHFQSGWRKIPQGTLSTAAHPRPQAANYPPNDRR
jgi:hypothetical protein